MSRGASNVPREPAGRSLKIGSAGQALLNDNRIAKLVRMLEDRRIVTEEGCAAICGALIALGESRHGKVQTLCNLGAAARGIVARSAR